MSAVRGPSMRGKLGLPGKIGKIGKIGLSGKIGFSGKAGPTRKAGNAGRPTPAVRAASAFHAPTGGAPVRRGAGVGAFLLAIVTAGALAHVGVRLKGLEVAYDLGHERRIATDLEEQRRRLQIEIGMLKDPARVISIARESLNMGPPASEAIRRLGSGTLARLPEPPVEDRKAAAARAGAAAPHAARVINPTASKAYRADDGSEREQP